MTTAAPFANNGYGRYACRRFKAACVLGRSPAVWLQQAEAQFAVRNVTADNTKYHYGVAAFDQATALRVIGVLEDPPQHNKYDNLKQRLTDIFGLSRRQRADQLLDIGLHSLGDRQPSQLMDEMLALLGSHKPCMLFESIFLRCMPEDIRLQLATSSFDDLIAGSRQNSGRILASERTVGCCFRVKHPYQEIRDTKTCDDNQLRRNSSKRSRCVFLSSTFR